MPELLLLCCFAPEPERADTDLLVGHGGQFAMIFKEFADGLTFLKERLQLPRQCCSPPTFQDASVRPLLRLRVRDAVRAFGIPAMALDQVAECLHFPLANGAETSLPQFVVIVGIVETAGAHNVAIQSHPLDLPVQRCTSRA
jgi:hypothetical protein